MRRFAAASLLVAIAALTAASLGAVIGPPAANVYIAQVAAGAANGTSCANPFGVSYFNNAADWGSGSFQIGAGTTVHLCGTITTALQGNGSGTLGSPITILFEPGAGQTFPFIPTTGAINVAGLSNIIIDGGSTVTCGYVFPAMVNVTCNNGSIQATANGSGLANQVGSAAIVADNSTNIEIRNLVIANVYQHTSAADDPPRSWCVHAYGTVTNLNIHNNTMHDVAWCLDGGGPGLKFEFNEVYRMDHGVGVGGPIASGTVNLDHNHLHDMANWDENSNSYHHDGFHMFTDNGAITATVMWWDNVCDGDVGNHVTSCYYREASVGAFQPFYSFNNVAFVAAGPSNFGRNSCCGFNNLYSDGGSSNSGVMVNDTVYGPGMYATSINGSQGIVGGGQTGATVQNNVWGASGGPTTQNVFGVNNGAAFVASGLSNNVYVNVGSSNAFVWKGTTTGSFTSWVSLSGETNAVFSTPAQLALNGSTGQPAATSTACGAGANLTSLGIAALDQDIQGNARPATGAWDAGAFNCAGSTPAPGVSFSPTSLSFANQQQSTTSPAQSVTITNSGTATLTISSITFGGTNPGDFGSTGCVTSIAAGSSCTASVTFAPTTTGARSALFTVTSNAPGSPNTISVSGTGTAPPVPGVGFSPTSVAFGNQTVNTTSASTAITLTNTGTAALTITLIQITGTNLSDFGQTNNCPLSPSTLAAAGTCTISVTATPLQLGARSGFVTVTDNASNSPQSVALSVTGTATPAPVASLSPSSVLGFGNQRVSTTSGAQTVTLKNAGNATLTISGIAASGNFANGGCGASLAPGASCSITVTFTPLAVGVQSGTLTITDNAGTGTQTVPLSGTGIVTPPSGSGGGAYPNPVLLTQ